MDDIKPKVVYDVELGGACVELPLGAIRVHYGSFGAIAPLPVYQCDQCFVVLPHKYDTSKRTLRITMCPRHPYKEEENGNVTPELA